VCRAVRFGLLAGPDTETDLGVGEAPPDEQSVPTTAAFLHYLIQMARSLLTSLLDRYRVEVWNVGVVGASIEDIVREGRVPSVRWLRSPPRHCFYADPFALPGESSDQILLEEMNFREGRGRISLVTLRDSEERRGPRPLIEQSCHMSYPYMFIYEGEIYCVPETYQAREVQLYRATHYPDEWSRVGTLIEDFAGIDSTVVMYESRWWLFCTDADTGSLDHLYIWHAESPLGPWIPHHLNPVKRNIRSSRPAGRPFVLDGWLHRPAQDCSRIYGGAVTINRIIKLDPTAFEEETVATIEPARVGRYADGIHTICPMGDQTLIDGKENRLSLFAPLFRRRILRVQDEQQLLRRPPDVHTHSEPRRVGE
jgi:hypothetical protein